jgi:hypothetical protein
MRRRIVKRIVFGTILAPAAFVTASLVGAAMAAAACTGPGAPTTTQTKCLTAVQIPGNRIRAFDISFDNPNRAEYYLADRSNAGIDIIDTQNLTFKRRLPGFVGVAINPGSITPTNPFGTTNNNLSGPDGVVTHDRWLYAGDGDSTLKVFDLNAPTATALKQTIKTGGTTRVDEMDLTTDGKLLLAANNAEDPPFGTLFNANGDNAISNTKIIVRIEADKTIIPPGAGLSIEQPSWDPKTKRFLVSIPTIANNPPGCNIGGPAPFCEGGLFIIDPKNLPAPTTTVMIAGVPVPVSVIGAFDPTTNQGVLPLHLCGPNGSSVGPNDNVLLGCTPGNVPDNTSTLVINAKTKNFANIGNITGSDEVWFNAGDDRYYTGSSANNTTGKTAAVLGVIDAIQNLLIETVPQSSGSHSVAADAKRNLIFVPQTAPVALVGSGGDTTTVGAGICGSTNGCVGVYVHHVEDDHDDQGQDDNQNN